MSGVRGVLNYAGCFAEAAESVEGVNGWEAGLRDGLGYIHDPLWFLAALGRTGAIPTCDATRKNAFYCVSVKISESPITKALYYCTPFCFWTMMLSGCPS